MLFFVFIAFCFAMMKEDDYIIDPELIAKINNDDSVGWKAGVNAVFVGKKFKDVKNMMGWLGALSETPKTSVEKKVAVPTAFDTYTQWPNCKHPIRNQAQCGSCWAFSAAEAMSDRFCIAGHDIILSPQDFVSCESDEYACQGGYLSREWEYLKKTGIVADKCFPYKSGGGVVPRCPYKCDDPSEAWKKHKVSGYTHYATPDDAMNAMYQHGSFQVAFSVYQDFFNYKSGVYHHVSGGLAGGHAVKAQGWGVESGTGQAYWNIANSWGTTWGMSGYFWIKRGNDECGIEDQMYGGIPAL